MIERTLSKVELRVHARTAIAKIFDRGLFGSNKPSPPGTLRGIDVLTPSVVVQKLSRAVQISYNDRRRLLNLVEPSGFFEKIVLAKFFAPVPMPSPANKLGVNEFVPDHIRDIVSPIPVLWSGSSALDRADIEALGLKAGRYYVKSNCGSGSNFQFGIPLTDGQAARIKTLSKGWLEHPHGVRAGEWWYPLIRPQVFIEADLAPGRHSLTDWKFHTAGGRILAVQVDKDRQSNHAQSMYDEDFNFIPEQMFFKTGEPEPRPNYYERMVKIAEAIGKRFDYARVDLYHSGGNIFLGEITLAPIGGQRPPISKKLDDHMGRKWTSGIFAPV